jgi:glycosyltransferase involved in cell wall biosynthesis
MLVTVITPSFNSGPFIEDTIRSVAEQEYRPLEHIVLDSNSTDETHDVLARWPDVRVIRDAPPTIAGKLELGLRLADGDILMWLNADDVLNPGAVTRAVAALERHPEVGLVYSNFMDIDEAGQVIATRPSRQCTARELIDEHDWVPHQTAFFRKQAAESVGGVDPRFPLVLDWDLWIRIAKEWPILYVDDHWGGFRVRDGQLSARKNYARWRQIRTMSRSHGGRFFSPIVLSFYFGKLKRALSLLARGDLRGFAGKLRANTLGRLRQRTW